MPPILSAQQNCCQVVELCCVPITDTSHSGHCWTDLPIENRPTTTTKNGFKHSPALLSTDKNRRSSTAKNETSFANKCIDCWRGECVALMLSSVFQSHIILLTYNTFLSCNLMVCHGENFPFGISIYFVRNFSILDHFSGAHKCLRSVIKLLVFFVFFFHSKFSSLKIRMEILVIFST